MYFGAISKDESISEVQTCVTLKDERRFISQREVTLSHHTEDPVIIQLELNTNPLSNTLSTLCDLPLRK